MRKIVFAIALALFIIPFTSHAQDQGAVSQVQEAQPNTAGEVRAPSPKMLEDRQGFFQIGAGAGYGAAMQTDSLMYNVVGSYNFNLSEHLTGKAFADLNFGSGEISSRLLNFGVGGEYYFPSSILGSAKPYVGADAGIGFARNSHDVSKTGMALGAGTGFRFQASKLNWDVNLHYTQLTAELDGQAPAVFALRGAVTF